MKKVVSFDCETFLITRVRPLPPLVCTSFYDGEESALLKHDDPELEHRFETLLRDDSVVFVNQNIAYDFGVIAAWRPRLLSLIFEAYKKNRVTDTAIRQQLWDISQGRGIGEDKVSYYSLATLVKMIFNASVDGKGGDDIWRLRYNELYDVPLDQWPEEATSYAINDAIWAWKIWDAQNEVQNEIRGEYERAYSQFCLSLMTARGMRTKQHAVNALEHKQRAVLDELTPGLVEAGLLVYDKRKKSYTKKKKPAQERIQKACESRGIAVPLTEKGQVSIDKVACVLAQDEAMLKRVEYSLAEKVISTYLPVVQCGVYGPITSKFEMAGTGRTTSSTPGKPLLGGNLQNAPRDGGIRECFYPRDGYVYLAGDFSGAELHTHAQSCLEKIGFAVLGDRLKEGDDVHSYMGANLIGIDYETFMQRLKNHDKEVKDARQDAKAANFGFPGGMKERGFIDAQLKQRGRLWEYEKVKTLRETWLVTFPENEDYFEFCKRALGPTEDAILEINSLGMLRRVQSLNQIANSFFQAPAALGALRAVQEVTRRCFCDPKSPLYGARPVNFIHDEIMLEVPLHLDPNAAAIELKKVMEERFNTVTPDYPVDVGPVLMSQWSKAAEPVFDDRGRLQIWNS